MTSPVRLRGWQHDEINAAVLADLTEHGPSSAADVWHRVHKLMGEHFVRRSLRGMVEAGKVTATKTERTIVIRCAASETPRQVRTTLYAAVEVVAKKGKRSRPDS